MKTIVHVNQHVIKANRKNGTFHAPLTVKTYRDTRYAQAVEFTGPSKLVYRPDAPLSCGAHAWIETEAPVRITP